MKNENLKAAAAHINAALTETRREAIDEAADVIWAQVKQYEKLLDSTEAWAIYMDAYGDSFLNLHKKRRTLTNKKNMLTTIFSKLSELKWKEQKEKEN